MSQLGNGDAGRIGRAGTLGLAPGQLNPWPSCAAARPPGNYLGRVASICLPPGRSEVPSHSHAPSRQPLTLCRLVRRPSARPLSLRPATSALIPKAATFLAQWCLRKNFYRRLLAGTTLSFLSRFSFSVGCYPVGHLFRQRSGLSPFFFSAIAAAAAFLAIMQGTLPGERSHSRSAKSIAA